MISLRLSPEIETQLNRLAKKEKKSRSEIIKCSIIEYLNRHQSQSSPYDLGIDLFATLPEGPADLSQNRKKHVAQIISRKAKTRSTR